MRTSDAIYQNFLDRYQAVENAERALGPRVVSVEEGQLALARGELIRDMLAEMKRIRETQNYEPHTVAAGQEDGYYVDQLQAVHFIGEDAILGPPPNWDSEKHGECFSLPVAHVSGGIISAWKPNEEQIARISEGCLLYLQVVGNVMPPVMISVHGEGKTKDDEEAQDTTDSVK